MLTHLVNRPHKVDQRTASFLYSLYELLFDSQIIELRIKQRTFENAAESKNAWLVVSISEAALTHIRNTGEAKGLQRGHILSRISRAEHMFKREARLTSDQLLDYFFKHDTVALVTKAENSKDGVAHWSQLHAVPEGLFNAGSMSIYLRKRKDIPWVQSHPVFNLATSSCASYSRQITAP
jgi:hypothetical protein